MADCPNPTQRGRKLCEHHLKLNKESTGRDDDGDVAGIVDFDGDDLSWVDQWVADGGDAAGFWAPPGEAGPLTGGIWGAPMGAEALTAGEMYPDGVVAVGEAIYADEPASISDFAQNDAAEVDTEGDAQAAVNWAFSFEESMALGMWSLSSD
jgi:hypothetical protein